MSNPATIVIFGATGDLTQRKLIPALFNQYCKGQLPQAFKIVGFAIEDYGDHSLRQRFQDGLQQFTPKTYSDEAWADFGQHIRYVQGNLTELADFERLEGELRQLEVGPADRLYYLAISPSFIAPTIENMGEAGMQAEQDGARKIIIEKPFGRDLATASRLNHVVHDVFAEEQVYRIDHYLGKETAQNVLFFRFANHVYESVWNRGHIDNIQITVAESVDVGRRAGYYDTAGVVRDMFQNHILQLLTLVTMEPPASFDAHELRNEKVKVLKSIRPIQIENTVRGQYDDYHQAEGVDPQSLTPTFMALKLYIDNWRWQGVPIYVRSGKALHRKVTEVVVEFKQPPRQMFDMKIGQKCSRNQLALCIQPDEGVHFRFEAKVPAESFKTEVVDMDWHYNAAFGEGAIPEAYERLLVDALNSDPSLFIRSDEIEAAWTLVDPVIQAWDADEGAPMQRYERMSWGPEASHQLIERDGFSWQLGCIHD